MTSEESAPPDPDNPAPTPTIGADLLAALNAPKGFEGLFTSNVLDPTIPAAEPAFAGMTYEDLARRDESAREQQLKYPEGDRRREVIGKDRERYRAAMLRLEMGLTNDGPGSEATPRPFERRGTVLTSEASLKGDPQQATQTLADEAPLSSAIFALAPAPDGRSYDQETTREIARLAGGAGVPGEVIESWSRVAGEFLQSGRPDPAACDARLQTYWGDQVQAKLREAAGVFKPLSPRARAAVAEYLDETGLSDHPPFWTWLHAVATSRRG